MNFNKGRERKRRGGTFDIDLNRLCTHDCDDDDDGGR
jgi:hypothetical protein